jgi:UDP-2,3-diacylglucosamine pyrophosphatase LpxH
MPQQDYERFVSVSDLHVGGTDGPRMFDQGALLAALIRRLAAEARDVSTALVLNGDTVDFLADAPPGRYLDPDPAGALVRLARDPAFAPVFEALAELVAAPRATLVVAIGNHDVELAFTETRRALLELLCGDDRAAHGRVVLATDGTGWDCTVGGRTVLCVHGNDEDPWNVVDHEGLRRLRQARRRGGVAELLPNAGTRLVADVMNGVKRRRPFVDLLKPEVEAVVPILLALDESLADKVWPLVRVAGTFGRDAGRRRAGLLEGGEDAPVQAADDPLAWAEGALQAGVDAVDLVEEGTLGATAALQRLVGLRPGPETLREALRARGTAEDFGDPGEASAADRAIFGPIGSGVPFVVAGHTHAARSLARPGGWYFNSGTWAKLVLLSWRQVETPEAFAPVLAALEQDRLEEAGLVARRPTVVEIRREGDLVRGRLAVAAFAGSTVTLETLRGANEHVMTARTPT